MQSTLHIQYHTYNYHQHYLPIHILNTMPDMCFFLVEFTIDAHSIAGIASVQSHAWAPSMLLHTTYNLANHHPISIVS